MAELFLDRTHWSTQDIRNYQKMLDELAHRVNKLKQKKDSEEELTALLKPLPKRILGDLFNNYHLVLRDTQKMTDNPDWRHWIFITSRSFGKTFSCGKAITRWANLGYYKEISILGKNVEDARTNNIYGPSGLIALADSFNPCKFNTATQELTYANGSRVILLSAMHPEHFRGRQCHILVCDEVVKYPDPDEAIRQAKITLRLKAEDPHLNPARVVITTSPMDIPIIHSLIKLNEADPIKHRLVRGQVHENADNLDANYVANMEASLDKDSQQYKQEILGEVVAADSSVFQNEMLERCYVYPQAFPEDEILKTVIAVDPAGSARKENDETGIVVASVCSDNRIYIREDLSCRAGPEVWAARAVEAYYKYSASYIVIESNMAKESHLAIFRGVDPNVPIKTKHHSTNKLARAQPVRALFAKEQLAFVGEFAQFNKLHTQLIYFTGIRKRETDDRADAMFLASADLISLLTSDTPQTPMSINSILKGGKAGSLEGGSFNIIRKRPKPFRKATKSFIGRDGRLLL